MSALDREYQLQGVEQLDRLIGRARLLALGEGVHGAAEPLLLRNRLFQHLVESHGFTAIAIESGIAESRIVHEYVAGGPQDRAAVLKEGFSWTFGELPQNEALVDWLRHTNTQRERKINFYGFDVPGSPGEPRARRGVETALVMALQYLKKVDAEHGEPLAQPLEPLLPRLKFGPRSEDRPGYESLSEEERRTLTDGIAELLGFLERGRSLYLARSSPSDYRWAVRTAVGALQTDRWLQHIPLRWEPSSATLQLGGESERFLVAAGDVRDRSMAENLDWILDEEGPEGRVLVYAHTYHLCGSSVRSSSWARMQATTPMGSYLRAQHGEAAVIVGNLIGEGSYLGDTGLEWLEPPEKGSVEAWAAEFGGQDDFLLDLRRASAELKEALRRAQPMRVPGGHFVLVEPTQAFDAVAYLQRVTPAYGAHV